MLSNIPGLRVCVRLGHTVWYEDAGQEKEVPAGTALDWLNAFHAFGVVTLDPDEDYEFIHGGGFTWAGATSIDLTQAGALAVALLVHDGQNFLVPIDELIGASAPTTEWDQQVLVATWSYIRPAQLYEVVKPLVLDGDDDDSLGDDPKPDTVTTP